MFGNIYIWLIIIAVLIGVGQAIRDHRTERKIKKNLVKKQELSLLKQKRNEYFSSEWIRRGCSVFQQGSYREALALFNKEIEINPDNWYAHNWKACLFRDCNYFKEALEEVSIALSITEKEWTSSDVADCYVLRGTIFNIQDNPEYNPEKALMDLQHSIKLNPNNYHAYKNIGTLFLDMNENDKAMDAFTTAIEFSDNEDINSCYAWLGVVYSNKEEWQKAIDNFNKYLLDDRTDERSLQVRFYRAKAFGMLCKLEEAANDVIFILSFASNNATDYLINKFFTKENFTLLLNKMEKKLKENPYHERWYLNIATLYEQVCDWKNALNYYLKAFEYGKKPFISDAIAYCYNLIGNLEKWREYAEYSLSLCNSDNFSFIYIEQLAHYYLAVKQYNRAIYEYSKCIESYPDFPDAYYERANLEMLIMKDYDNALKDYNKLLELQTNPSAYTERGLLHKYMGNEDLAKQDFQKAVELQDSDFIYIAYVYLDEREKAIDWINKGIEQNACGEKRSLYAEYQAAKLYSLLNDTDKAIHYLKIALSADFRIRLVDLQYNRVFDNIRISEEFNAVVSAYENRLNEMNGVREPIGFKLNSDG
ncbi:MAG: tetratricopeptide repeat protein [Bacteroidales bacterium]|nr:tetratricopeptide repeat protein [Bacteroidales bacterium]